MTDAQAHEIVTLIRAATASRVEEQTVDYFQAALGHLDFELALQAATLGTVTWRRFPSWADFKEIYRAQQRLAEPVGEQRLGFPPAVEGEEEGKRGDHAPDWVHVWSWARTKRNPRNMFAFPQQESHVDPANVMTLEDYEALHVEWVEAGSPKADKPIPMAR